MWLLLLGTAAPALERMSCSMGCPSEVGIGSIEDCCPEEHDDHESGLMADDCCDVERAAPEHHAFTHENTFFFDGALAQATEHIALNIPQATQAEPGYALDPRPPPLLTAERLSRVRSFLI